MSVQSKFFTEHDIEPHRIRQRLTRCYVKTTRLSDLEIAILSDIISYFVRNRIPDAVIDRLSEKYQSQHETIRGIVTNIVRIFQGLNSVSAIHTDIDKELSIISYIAQAKFPDSNRWKMAEALGLSTREGNNSVAALLDRKLLTIVDYNGVRQLSVTKSIDLLYEYAKSREGFCKHHLDKIHRIINDHLQNEPELEDPKQNDKRIDDILSGLDNHKKEMVRRYIKAICVDDLPPPPTVPPARYVNYDESGDIVDFINQHYRPYMDGILFGRKELATCDPKAAKALANYETRHGKVSTERLNLPTITQKNKALVAGLSVRQMVAAHSIMNTKNRREMRKEFLD